MTIRRVELVRYAIPLRAPLRTAYGLVAQRDGVLVVLHGDDGSMGLGEATPHPAAPPDALPRMQRALREAGAALCGASLDRLDALCTACPEPAAAAGLDMALHDLAGRATGRSVAELLGGARRTHVVASALLAGETAGALAAAARDAVARGYAAAKVKVGPSLDEAVRRVEAVRAAAPGLALRADANGAWTAAVAGDAARRLRGLDWLEQPAHDEAGLAAARAGGVRVAADERVTGPDAVAALVRAGAADVVVLKLVQVGGLARAATTAETARRGGLVVAVTTALDTSLATAAALQLAATLPEPLPPCGLATTDLLAGDLVRPRVAPGPSLPVPCGPGLGVALDPEALARCRVAEAA